MANKVDKIVFSSTCATYGMPEVMPITESTPQVPISPYGWSKLFVERMLKDYDAAHGMRSISLRYFNAAGADPDGEIGERHEPETHLIPLAIRATMPGDFELTVFGDDFDTPDGTCVRDYVHVTDLANAHVGALERLMEGAGSGAFNLGTGQGASVREIIAAVERATGRRVRHRVGLRRQGDPPVVVAAIGRAEPELRWTPQHSAIGILVRDAWRWETARRFYNA